MCVDVEKAYDGVDIRRLAMAMFILRFNSFIIKWLMIFNKRRMLRLSAQDVEVSKGLAQGSSLRFLTFTH